MRRYIWVLALLGAVCIAGSVLYAGAPLRVRGTVGTAERVPVAASVGTDDPTALLMEVKASKQGVLPGAAPDGRIPVLTLQHLITAPRDATGLPTGKRIHQPLVISKAVDTSSPGLYAALTTNEVLPKVTIKWYRGSENYFITELTNAVISSIDVQPGTPGGEVEKVAFAYQKITWTSLPDNHVAMDDAH
jgi:type VI secretion system secreted protein Hcp